MAKEKDDLGSENIGKLLFRQAVPASVGILFMTVNILITTIFVGQWIGPMAIGALTVISPVAFFISSLGLSIGIGGSSVLSRALGSGEKDKATAVFAHQIVMTVLITSILSIAIFLFSGEILNVLGAKGKIEAPAKLFLYPILIAAPIQALCSMANSVVRAEDKSKFAMIAVIIASASNILLDILFIRILDMGIFGAALATALSFGLCFLFLLWFFIFKSDLQPKASDFIPQGKLIGEISALSATTFSRQGVITILSVLLNNTLFTHGGEHAVTIYGIISRMLMFALFPVNGITEGFLPIAGFNYGAEKYDRVRESIKKSVIYAGFFAVVIYAAVFIFAGQIVTVFTDDAAVIRDTPEALRWVFAASPVIAVQLIGAAYFQAAGKALKALLLTLTKQGFFLIPLILILPEYFGIFGIWVAFPIADLLATAVTGSFLIFEMRTKLKK